MPSAEQPGAGQEDRGAHEARGGPRAEGGAAPAGAAAAARAGDGDCKKTVQDQQAQLAQLGVRGTPAFFINGRYLSGAQPIENFKRLIDEELKKANDAIAKGMKVEDYYTKVVLEGGKKSI